MGREGDVLLDGRVVGSIEIVMLEEGDLGRHPPAATSYAPPAPDDAFGDGGGAGSGYGGGGKQTPFRRGPEKKAPHPPTFRKGVGPGRQYKGPTFRPHLTPRGKAPPDKPPHFTVEDIHAALEGGKRGSAYLKDERKWIADELKANERTRDLVRGVMAVEQSQGTRSMVFESMANRLNFMRAHGHPNLTVGEYLNRTGTSQFYAGLRSNKIRTRADQVKGTPEGESIDREMDKVLEGSNDVVGFTDQGSKNDPNFHLGQHIDFHGESYNDFGGRGGQGPAQRWREEQQRRVAGGGSTDATGKPVGVTRLPGVQQPSYYHPDDVPVAAGDSTGPFAQGNVPSPITGTVHQGPGAARRGHIHQGVDIFAPVGTPVKAMGPGRVTAGHYSPGITGGIVDVQYDNGMFGRYMHLSKWDVLPVGARVDAGQVVGLSGDPPGTTNMPHLHYEIYQGPGRRGRLDPAEVHGWGRFGPHGEGLFGTRVSSDARGTTPTVAAPTPGSTSAPAPTRVAANAPVAPTGGVFLFLPGMYSRGTAQQIASAEAAARNIAAARRLRFESVDVSGDQAVRQLAAANQRLRQGGVAEVFGFSGGAWTASKLESHYPNVRFTKIGAPKVYGDVTIPGVSHWEQPGAYAARLGKQ